MEMKEDRRAEDTKGCCMVSIFGCAGAHIYAEILVGARLRRLLNRWNLIVIIHAKETAPEFDNTLLGMAGWNDGNGYLLAQGYCF
jgi:hypothetical protein